MKLIDKHVAEVHLVVWEITETLDELQNLLVNFDDYGTEYAAIPTEKRRKEFLLIRILANILSGQPARVEYNEYGKPYLLKNALNVSFTHSSKWVGAISHAHKNTGIDIECPTEKIIKVASRFTNENERKYFSIDKYRPELLLIWCAKESVFKMKGSAFTDFAETMQVLPFTATDKGLFYMQLSKIDEILEVNYELNNDFALTWCVD